MAFGELLSDAELPEHVRDARRQVLLGSALRLALRRQIDGQHVDDEERACFTEYAGKLFMDGMSPEQQARYVEDHLGVRLDAPHLGVVADNLPVDFDEVDVEVRGSIYASRKNPEASAENLRALHVLIGEELVNSQGNENGVDAAA